MFFTPPSVLMAGVCIYGSWRFGFHSAVIDTGELSRGPMGEKLNLEAERDRDLGAKLQRNTNARQKITSPMASALCGCQDVALSI